MEEQPLQYRNLNWKQIVTPIKVDEFWDLLMQSDYDKDKTNYLINRFQHGFDLGYRGPSECQDLSENIPIRECGSELEMWNKVMNEVKAKCYVGPFNFKDLPFKNFMQSPIGLVLKAGYKTRLIFHLSYDFGEREEQKSFNHHTPKELCSVKYNDIEHAVKACLDMMSELKSSGQTFKGIYFGKSDLSNAFRLVPGKVSQRKWLLLKARHPRLHETYFFVDLCMPFGVSIICAIFQSFSNALKRIMDWILQKKP